MTDESRFPLEAACRLSRSVLWRLQRRFFEQRGIAAWSEGVVPHHVTSNPGLARAYGPAGLFLGLVEIEPGPLVKPVRLFNNLGADST